MPSAPFATDSVPFVMMAGLDATAMPLL